MADEFDPSEFFNDDVDYNPNKSGVQDDGAEEGPDDEASGRGSNSDSGGSSGGGSNDELNPRQRAGLGAGGGSGGSSDSNSGGSGVAGGGIGGDDPGEAGSGSGSSSPSTGGGGSAGRARDNATGDSGGSSDSNSGGSGVAGGGIGGGGGSQTPGGIPGAPSDPSGSSGSGSSGGDSGSSGGGSGSGTGPPSADVRRGTAPDPQDTGSDSTTTEPTDTTDQSARGPAREPNPSQDVSGEPAGGELPGNSGSVQPTPQPTGDDELPGNTGSVQPTPNAGDTQPQAVEQFEARTGLERGDDFTVSETESGVDIKLTDRGAQELRGQREVKSGDALSGVVSGVEDVTGLNAPGDGSLAGQTRQDAAEQSAGEEFGGRGQVEEALRDAARDFNEEVVSPAASAAGEAAASDFGRATEQVASANPVLPTPTNIRRAQAVAGGENPFTAETSAATRRALTGGAVEGAGGLANLPQLAVTGIEAGEVADAFVRSSPAVEGGQETSEVAEDAAGAAAVMGVDLARAAQSNPTRFAGQLTGGALAGGAAVRAAARVGGPGAAETVNFAVDPAEAARKQLFDADSSNIRSFVSDESAQADLTLSGRGESGDGSGGGSTSPLGGDGGLPDDLQDALENMGRGRAVRRANQRAEDQFVSDQQDAARRQERGQEAQSVQSQDPDTIQTVSGQEDVFTASDTRPSQSGPSATESQAARGRGTPSDSELSPREQQIAGDIARTEPDADLRDIDAREQATPDQDLRDQAQRSEVRADEQVRGRVKDTSLVGSAAGSTAAGAQARRQEAEQASVGLGAGLGVGSGLDTNIEVTPDTEPGTTVDQPVDTEVDQPVDVGTDQPQDIRQPTDTVQDIRQPTDTVQDIFNDPDDVVDTPDSIFDTPDQVTEPPNEPTIRRPTTTNPPTDITFDPPTRSPPPEEPPIGEEDDEFEAVFGTTGSEVFSSGIQSAEEALGFDLDQ